VVIGITGKNIRVLVKRGPETHSPDLFTDIVPPIRSILPSPGKNSGTATILVSH
jgi:hypothetical protein